MSVSCCVCGRRVRVASRVLVKHRDLGGSYCDNAGSSVEANAKGRYHPFPVGVDR